MGNRTICGGAAAQHCVDECTKLQLELDGRSRDAEEPECDPAGAVFNETLRGTSPLEQEALRFSSSSNLSAVRWLLSMGSSPQARDRNGTTMLHAACRSGSCSIVQELVRYGLPLDSVDAAGWTPLHIAVVMGRREVSLLLLRARAQLNVKNKRGKTPVMLCSDPGTKEVLDAFGNEGRGGSTKGLSRTNSIQGAAMGQSPAQQPLFHKEHLNGANSVLGSYDEYESTCEPFFVPRFPLFHDEAHRAEIVRLGMDMLNRSPGHGLAFLVATGAVHDHPTDLSAFVLKHGADPAQLGEFLGEDFSLAQTLRLAFIHSVDLKGTGVVSALVKAFKHIHAPPDLRKIDRLTSGIAHLWWRTHDESDDDWEDEHRGEEEGLDWTMFVEDPNHAPVDIPENAEACGMELRRSFHSVEGFRRLMFSTVMLCWNLHAAPRIFPSASSPKRLSRSEWLDLNMGIEADGGNVPVYVQKGIYQKINMGGTPQLLPDFSASSPPVSSERGDKNGVADETITVKGWASIPHGGLERLDPLLHTGGGAGGLAHCIFSETSSSPSAGMPNGPGLVQRTHTVEGGGEAVWLTLQYSLFLFLWASPSEPAPYAFIRLQDAVLRDVDYTAQHLVLAGRPKGRAELEKEAEDFAKRSSGEDGPLDPHSQTASRPLPFGDPRLPLPLCFLLADGRFQPFEALWLEIQFNIDEDLETWARELGAACDGLDLQEMAKRDGTSKDGSATNGKGNSGVTTDNKGIMGPKGRGNTRAPTAPLPGSPPPSPPVLAEDREGSARTSPTKAPSPRPAG